MKWTRRPQEQEGQKYFFDGKIYMTPSIAERLTLSELEAILRDVKEFAQLQDGCDYLQVYESEEGETIWLIDELSKPMIESGKFTTEHHYFTILYPHEY